MTDADLIAFADALPEPVLILGADGAITGANASARRQLLATPVGTLQDFVEDPAPAMRLLDSWLRSTQPLPGVLRVQTPKGVVEHRADGARVSGVDGPPRALVRLRPRSVATAAFQELNTRAASLADEVGRRMSAESRLAAQLQLLEVIARGASIDTALEAIVRLVEAESTKGALASILVLEDGRLRHGAGPSLPAAYNEAIDGVAPGPAVGSCGTAAFTGEPVVVSDIASDPLWANYKDLALSHGLRACWSVPVRSPAGDVVATVAHYYTEPLTPTPADQRLCDIARHFAGIAIERHRVEQALRQRAAELAEIDARKNEFLAMLGYELRNPLSSMVLAVERLASVAPDDETPAIVKRQLSLLRRLVDDLLDVARVTQGKVELRRTKLDLREIVGLIDRSEEGNPRVDIRIPDSPVWVEGDGDRLHQVFGNLLHNARKFTPATGKIDVVIDEHEGAARMRVIDDGEGMDRAELDEMFELFAQSKRELHRPEGGLGIGLTLARALVEGHGGTICARSDGRGHGSEFEIRLPLTQAPARTQGTAPLTSGAASQATPHDGLHVLVVDDDEDAALLLSLQLETWGHRARAVHDGQAGLEAAVEHEPDLVILDIGLPGLDGFEVARRLRDEHGVGRDACKLVALTGYGQASDRQRATDSGFDEFLVKPVDLKKLEELLARSRPRERAPSVG